MINKWKHRLAELGRRRISGYIKSGDYQSELHRLTQIEGFDDLLIKETEKALGIKFNSDFKFFMAEIGKNP
jgi:hypothetical protein